MKRTLPILITLITLLSFLSFEAYGTHVIGSEITYKSLGGKKYKITIKVYEDCGGPGVSGWGGAIYCRTDSVNLPLTKIGVKKRAPTCDSITSTCKNGLSMNEYTFESIVDFGVAPFTNWKAAGCCEIYIGFGQGSRHRASTITNSYNNFYTEAMINLCNIDKTKIKLNNSPTLTSSRIAYLCCNNPFYYNIGAVDTLDKDSLSYSLVNSEKAFNQSVNYLNGFDSTHPMSVKCPGAGNNKCKAFPNASPPLGLYCDNSNGDIIFTPVKCDEIGAIAIDIKEWRKDLSGNYVHVGTVRRDLELVVQNCGPNNPPQISSNAYNYTICEGDTVKIVISGNDTFNITDTVSLGWNEGVDGAQFVIRDTNAREKIADFCWIAKSGTASNRPYRFTVTAKDDNCPVNSVVSRGFTIKVIPKAKIERKYYDFCHSQGIVFEAKVDPNFPISLNYSWKISDTSGNLLRSTQKRYDTIQFSKIGSYYFDLSISNNNNCRDSFRDTVQLKPSSLNIDLGKDTSITDNDTLVLNAGGNFSTYLWSDNSKDSSIKISGAVLGKGNYLYWVCSERYF